MEEKVKFLEGVNKDSKNEISQLNGAIANLRSERVHDNSVNYNLICNSSFNVDNGSSGGKGKLNYKKGLLWVYKEGVCKDEVYL